MFIFKKEKKLIVPERVKREEIIDKEHSASVHFGVDSTAVRLKERYWWPKLEKYVENCSTCIRNDHGLVLNHPAFVNKVENLFDEVSIDFSWGFPETREGYKGTMNIINEMSNFC